MFGRGDVSLSFLEESEGSTSAVRPSPVTARAASAQAPRAGRRLAPRGRSSSAAPPRVLIFDVSDLVTPRASFVAPEMNVLGSGSDIEWPDPPDATATIDEDQLLDLIRASIPEELLTEESTISLSGGRLIVTNPAR